MHITNEKGIYNGYKVATLKSNTGPGFTLTRARYILYRGNTILKIAALNYTLTDVQQARSSPGLGGAASERSRPKRKRGINDDR
ncbi:hypothetical protein HN011_005353 [Eciton burchellii]|nr:hypothetical protein HN011_005353 [Eciton burchellii]